MQYLTNGFNLLSPLEGSGLKYYDVATTISITKGQVINDNGSGYATNVLTAFDATFWGIAAADADNTSGADGAIKVAVIPPLPQYRWRVKNESATVAAQTDIGEEIDLDSNDGVDVTDTSSTAWCFKVDKIDISTNAVAANTGGFVEGSFVRT